MKVLIEKYKLVELLDGLVSSYDSSHNFLIQEKNIELLEKLLPPLLGYVRETKHEELEGYILLAHLSEIKLYVSLKESKFCAMMNKERHEFDVKKDDAVDSFYNLQGWQQVAFLPMLVLFLLNEYYKNIAKKDEKTDLDRNMLLNFLLDELWIAVNAFRIRSRCDEILSKPNQLTKAADINSFLLDFITDFSEIAKTLAQKEKVATIIFPCGITKEHAIYFSFTYFEDIYHLYIFNVGYGSKRHKNDGKLIYPYYVGSIKSDNLMLLIGYLGVVVETTYEKKVNDAERTTDMLEGVYNTDNRFDLLQRKQNLAENGLPDVPPFPEQIGSNCVTHNYMAGLLCRSREISHLKDEAASPENNVYKFILEKFKKYAVSSFGSKENESKQDSDLKRANQVRAKDIKETVVHQVNKSGQSDAQMLSKDGIFSEGLKNKTDIDLFARDLRTKKSNIAADVEGSATVLDVDSGKSVNLSSGNTMVAVGIVAEDEIKFTVGSGNRKGNFTTLSNQK